MQRSFSIVQDDDFAIGEDLNDDETHTTYKGNALDLSDSEENSNSPKRTNPDLTDINALPSGKEHRFSRPHREQISKIPSAGTSGRHTVLRKRPTDNEKLLQISSESDDDDNVEKGKFIVPGEYDPTQYDNLDINEEIKEIFQYITKYIPQQLNLDCKFKPFVPEFLPAVGDIDAFLKVLPPEYTLTGDKFNETNLQLGLTVLDEPAANQSDPALLHLQLRANSVNPTKKRNENLVVKKIENLEQNSKTIEKWIKDISDLHKSKSSVVVRYSEPMPDLDDLMQAWPEETEKELNKKGFPKPEQDTRLADYVVTVCNTLQIPVTKNKIQSLHLFFCLYAAIKQTQLYQASTANNAEQPAKTEQTDQLVLD